MGFGGLLLGCFLGFGLGASMVACFTKSQEKPKRRPRWRVIGDARVRLEEDGEEVALPVGTILQEKQRVGNRIRFAKLEGDGPSRGWVDLESCSGEALLEPHINPYVIS